MDVLSDAELFDMVRMGDKKALSTLFVRYYDQLYHFGCRITQREILVEESIQELFIYIFESHTRLSKVQNVKAYLFRSFQRRLLLQLNKERKISNAEDIDSHQQEFFFLAEDFLLKESQQSQSLAAILNELPWQQREAIYLRYYNNLSTKEIAEVMGLANQTVLNTLYIVLKKVRKKLGLRELIILLIPLARLASHFS